MIFERVVVHFYDNELTAKIEKRISSIMNVPVSHGEGLHILNYEVDQQYKAHYDYFAEHSRSAANNRISTLVMYLNDVEEGGETFFPKLNLSVHPRKEWQYTLSISIKINH